MKIDIVSLFPGYFELSLRQSLLGKGLDKKLFEIEITDPRAFATDKHATVDDRPFGGSAGMVLKVGPLDRCLAALGHPRAAAGVPQGKETIILTSAAGRPFDQSMAKRYSLNDRLTIICGHYLGVDERLLRLYDIDEVSIGDYTLSGGEPAALVMIDAVVRLLPGVLGNFESALGDSHMERGLGSPHYTRPAEYEGLAVPEALLSGDHARIERFRQAAALRKCLANRPDLLSEDRLTKEERKILDEFENNK
ncbi:MAG: tRNA (guanosine(37)-N1)-methyltransferase TrmD [bacterium]